MNPENLDRREFLGLGVAAAMLALPQTASFAAPSTVTVGDDRWHGLKIGVASYTFRSFPLDGCIKGIQRVGLKYVSIKDMHLPMKSTADECKSVAQKFKDAGIIPLSCGVVYMPADEPGIRAAFEYARDLGVPTIVCSFEPSSVALLDKMVKEYDIRLAIHNHGPGDKRYPRPSDVIKIVEAYDKRLGLCIDIGHTLRAGEDPAQSIVKFMDRLYDIHLKDVNRADEKGSALEAGRGVLDMKSVFKAMLQAKFTGLAGFEYEKDGNDPIPGLAESVGYCKGILTGM